MHKGCITTTNNSTDFDVIKKYDEYKETNNSEIQTKSIKHDEPIKQILPPLKN